MFLLNLCLTVLVLMLPIPSGPTYFPLKQALDSI